MWSRPSIDIAEAYGRLRDLQEKRLDKIQNNKPVDKKLDARYEEARNEVVELVNQIQLNSNRVDSLVDQLYQVNKTAERPGGESCFGLPSPTR